MIGETYNIGTDFEMSTLDVAKAILTLEGKHQLLQEVSFHW